MEPSERLLVVQSEELEPEPADWLAERCEYVECSFRDRTRFLELMARASGLIVRSYTRVDQDLLEQAPELRAVARPGVGLDNIDLEACRHAGVRVLHTPGANAQAVVELVLAFAMDALRPRVFLDSGIGLDDWKSVRSELTGLRELGGLRVGVYGMGTIGRRVARVMIALGCEVVYHDFVEVDAAERHGAVPVSREELLRSCDLITVHVDERQDNRGLLGTEAFGLMKPDAVFLNTSRGLVVDVPACAAFFAANPGASALLDVHDPEPFGDDYPLLGLPNVHLSPHIGGATRQAKLAMSWVVRDLWRVLQGEPPHHAAV